MIPQEINRNRSCENLSTDYPTLSLPTQVGTEYKNTVVLEFHKTEPNNSFFITTRKAQSIDSMPL